MPEPSQPNFVNQPHIERITAPVHAGVGDQNIYAGFGSTIKSLRQNGHDQEAKNLETILDGLRRLHDYQHMANELSRVLTMLHDLEFALATIEPSLRRNLGRARIDFDSIDETWRAAIRTPMKNLKHFVSNEIAFLGERYKVTEDTAVGPEWFLKLALLQQYFETSLKEHRIIEMYDRLLNMLDTCRTYLSELALELVTVTNQIIVLSSETLARIDNG